MENIQRRDLVKTTALAGIGAATLAIANTARADEGSNVEDALEKITSELDRLASVEEIRNQLFNYVQSIDRIDYELGYGCFAEDSVLDYGEAFKGTGREFIDYCLPGHMQCTWTHHLYGAMHIDVDGDKAGSSTYGHINILAPVDGEKDVYPGDPLYVLHNQRVRYHDLWERRSGRWVIVNRVVSYDISYHEPVYLEGWPANENAFRGDECFDDPSYAVVPFHAGLDKE